MTLRKGWNVAVLAAGLAALGATGCSRDHIEAINLANRADQSVKVNVEGAIQLYEQARQLDPTNHRILWKLATAYEKKEDWEKMASTLALAAQQAPEFANYYFKRGLGLVQLAEAGAAEKYEEAKAPLQKCVEKDANLAECYHFLGESHEWTDNLQGALENYFKAIQHDPSVAYFYPPVAELLVTLKLYDEAEKVLKEGARLVTPGEKTKNNLYSIYVLLFAVAQAKNDKPGMLVAMERAKEVAGEAHPEIGFNLGSTYAVMDPPRKDKALRLLKSFAARACRSRSAVKFKQQCETAQSLIQQMSGP
ncbi:tetratricopeptide repeat protein [Myxococcota bacterium]